MNILAMLVSMATTAANNVTVRTMLTVSIETENACVDLDMMGNSAKTSAR